MAKRKILGCSFPVVIGVGILLLLLVIYSLAGGPIGSAILNINYPDWLKVSRPAPELPAEVIFNTGGFAFTNSMIATWITIVVVVLLSYLAFRKPRLIPRGLQSMMEFIFGSLLSFCQSIAGERNGRRFFPVVATIFIFVLANAWLSLLPFYGNALYVGHNIPLIRGANTDINVPLGIALFSFVSVWYFGIRMHGLFQVLIRICPGPPVKNGFRQAAQGKHNGGIRGPGFWSDRFIFRRYRAFKSIHPDYQLHLPSFRQHDCRRDITPGDHLSGRFWGPGGLLCARTPGRLRPGLDIWRLNPDIS